MKSISLVKNDIPRVFCLSAVIFLTALLLSSCYSTGRYDTQKGALMGAAVGALAGQAIGKNTTSTIIGGGTGAAIGALIGNAQDQKNQEIRDNQKTQPTVAESSHSYSDTEPPPGKWVTVPGRWKGNTWIPVHKRWVPVTPGYY